MPTYEENRKKINQRLYEINTTMDRKEAYESMVDYIMNVAEQCYKQGINDIKHWEVYTSDWKDKDTAERLIAIGLKKLNSGK